MDFKQRWVIDQKNKKKLLDLFPHLTNKSGIYFLTREENGFKYFYVGQSVHCLDRLAEHLRGYQHIDLSLKKHKLFEENNLNGWQVNMLEYPVASLDKMEQYFIKQFIEDGYVTYNHTTGSQDSSKSGLKETIRKGYKQGVEYGYEKCWKEIRELFTKYLSAGVQGKTNKIKERKLESFVRNIKGGGENECQGD